MVRIYYKAKSGLLCDRYPSNLTAEEGDPFIEVSDDDFSSSLATEVGKVWKVIGGKLENVEDDSEEAVRERERQSKEARIAELENWFSVYDNQVSQYLRASRRGELIALHIGEKVYQSIDEMDEEADRNQQELHDLRKELGK